LVVDDDDDVASQPLSGDERREKVLCATAYVIKSKAKYLFDFEDTITEKRRLEASFSSIFNVKINVLHISGLHVQNKRGFFGGLAFSQPMRRYLISFD